MVHVVTLHEIDVINSRTQVSTGVYLQAISLTPAVGCAIVVCSDIHLLVVSNTVQLSHAVFVTVSILHAHL